MLKVNETFFSLKRIQNFVFRDGRRLEASERKFEFLYRSGTKVYSTFQVKRKFGNTIQEIVSAHEGVTLMGDVTVLTLQGTLRLVRASDGRLLRPYPDWGAKEQVHRLGTAAVCGFAARIFFLAALRGR